VFVDHKINSADLTDLIDAIVAALPRHSRIAAEVERTSTQWLALLL